MWVPLSLPSPISALHTIIVCDPRCPETPTDCCEHLLPPAGPMWHCFSCLILRGGYHAFRCSEETPLCISGLSTDCLSSLKTVMRAGEMVQCVKAPATKTGNLSLIPGLTSGNEKTRFHKLSSDLHWDAVASSIPTPYTQAHTIHKQ